MSDDDMRTAPLHTEEPPMTIMQFKKFIPDEEAAIDYFIKIRYPDGLVCPHCGAKDKVYHYRQVKKLCHCKNCNNSFSPFKGTIFEKSTTGMWKWLYTIQQFLKTKGISAYSLYEDIEVTYKTAWRMLHQIRQAMEDDELKPFGSLVEVDETYVGGKPKRYPPKKGVDLSLLGSSDVSIIEIPDEVPPKVPPTIKPGRGTRKTPVFGIKERESWNVYARIMLPDELGKKLTGRQLLSVIEKVCKEGTTVISDDFSSYKILDEPDFLMLLDDLEPTARFGHKTVCHSRGEYVAPCGVHTNGIESFWALFKRGHHGTYHSMSVKWMQRYLDEFCFRQNNRKLSKLDRFDLLLKQSIL